MNEAVKLLDLRAPSRAALSRPMAGFGLGPPGVSPAPAEAAALERRLCAAERAAHAGRWDSAHLLCAGAILDCQPLLAASPPLLRRAVAALLRCRAFGQLRRLLLAVQGRTVRFEAGPAPAGQDEVADHVLDPGWFTGGAAAEPLISRWAAVLAAAPLSSVSGAAYQPVAH